MNFKHIESEARRLQVEVWSQRKVLFELGDPPIQQVLSPDVAARVCGLEYEYRDRIGAATGGYHYEAAGLFDRERGIISISTHFPFEVQRFTGGHELGHFVLHEWVGDRVAHRDRCVVDGLTNPNRPLEEREADYFAACYLAPKRLVETEFRSRFGRVPLKLSETLAFHLRGSQAQALLTAVPGSLDFAIAVAGCHSLDGQRFVALADHFGISVTAMAIRLRELDLVAS